MALTKKSAIGVMGGVVAAGFLASNPNFSLDDVLNINHTLESWTSNQGFQDSGKLYVLEWAATAACIAGVMYNALTGKLYDRKK